MATENPAAPKAPRKPRAPKAAPPVATTETAVEAAAPKKKPAAPRKAAAAKKSPAPAAVEPSPPEIVAAEAEEALVVAPASLSTEERIRLAAYRRDEARGYVAGDPLQDWVEAEREVSRQHA
jgi:hypothetical protein